MNTREYLKSIGMTDQQIADLEKNFPGDLLTKAFQAPLEAKAAAEAAAKKANEDLKAFEDKYNNEVLPEVSKAFKDAIDTRTKNAALEARLKAATEYGFLAEDPLATPSNVPGVTPGTPVRANNNTVPGSPELDPRYVQSADFTKAVDSIPDMLGRLTKMSNEHFSLYGTPLLDVDEMIAESKKTGGKKSVYDIWNERYKVEDKRKEVAAAKQAERDKKLVEEGVQKYLSEHGQPFTRPAVPSIATKFIPSNATESRQPWKGAKDRQNERHATMMNAWAKGKAGTVNSVQ